MQSSNFKRAFLSNEFWQQTSTHLGIIFLMSLPLLFWRLGGWPFFDPDEGRYAEISREMLKRHDWVTPTLNYVKYFEKPPLLYWLNAISFQLFGLHEWAGRLVPASAALLGMYLAYALGRRMWGARGGLLAALILGTSMEWPIIGREVVIDTLLSTLIFATLAFWWLSHTQEETHSREKYFYDAAFWISLALAFLSKGPVAVILTGGGIFFYLLICRQWQALRRMGWWWGVPLCALIIAPWFVMVAQRNPEFNHFFWWGQNFGRFLGIGKNREHVKSFFYFFEFLPVVFFPWSFFIPGAVLQWKKLFAWPPNTIRRRAVIFLLSNSIFITLFFSASSSKLITYILPVLPFLAVLMGGYFDTLLRREKAVLFPRISAWLLGIILSVMLIACAIIVPKELVHREDVSALFAIAPCTALALWIIGLIWAARLKSIGKISLVTIGGFTLLWISVLPVISAVAPHHSPKMLLEYIAPGLSNGGEIMLYQNLSQSVSFYTRRRVRIIADRNEISFGASLLGKAEREYWFPENKSVLRKELQRKTPVYVMVDHEKALNLVNELKPLAVEIIWNDRRSIIGNPAAAKLTPPQKSLHP